MDLKHDAWYVKLYFVCAFLQSCVIEEQLDTWRNPPRNLCHLMRMYLWGLLCLPVVLFLLVVAIGAICLVATLIVGVPWVALTDSGDTGTLLRWVIAGFVGVCAALSVGEYLWKRARNRWFKRKPARPSLWSTRSKKAKGPSFAVVFGQWLEDRSEKSRFCRTITLVD